MTLPSEAKLSVIDLQAQYSTENGTIRAVDHVSFTINKNESLGIAGESACGKSSLGAAILRIMQPPGKVIGGNIILDGNDIAKLSDTDFNKRIRWKKISMVFQGAMNSLDPVYTIGDQLKEILEQHNFKGLIDDKISESLEQVGLDQAVSKKYPHELSGGMKQRVVIAMALLLDPNVVIADEPTTALDMLAQSQIISLLNKLRKENRLTIILITHDLALVSQIADKIAIMYAGQLVEVSATSNIYKNPEHPYTQALIEAMPRLRTTAKKIHFIKGRPPSLLHPPTGCRFYNRCMHAMDVCRHDP